MSGFSDELKNHIRLSKLEFQSLAGFYELLEEGLEKKVRDLKQVADQSVSLRTFYTHLASFLSLEAQDWLGNHEFLVHYTRNMSRLVEEDFELDFTERHRPVCSTQLCFSNN